MLCTLALTLGSLHAQENLSANLGIGLGLPLTDLNDNSYQGYRPNLALTTGIGYQLGTYFRLRGDLLAGQFNGNNEELFYQASIYEGTMALEFNLAELFNKETNFKFNVVGGLCYGLLSSSSYNRETRQRVVEIPNKGEASYSLYNALVGGVNMGIPFTPNFDLNVGYGHRQVIDQPWFDATQSGDQTDVYGMITVGFTYYLSRPKEEGKIEVDEARFRNLRKRVDSLEQQATRSKEDEEKIAALVKGNQEKEMQIELLKLELDSLKSKIDRDEADIKTADYSKKPNEKEEKQVTEVRADLLGKVMYRIVIVSLPTRAMAQSFIENTELDDSEMIIAYIENIDRFRVIYKSAETKAEARKYVLEARRRYKAAWIAKF